MSNRHPATSPRKRAKSPRKKNQDVNDSYSQDSVMLTPHASQPAFVNSHAPLTPRTPKSVRSSDADGDETEMMLLNEVDGHAHFSLDMDMEEDAPVKVVAKKPFSTKDKQGMALLSVLCEQSHVFGRIVHS
jgi:hypothetical protein